MIDLLSKLIDVLNDDKFDQVILSDFPNLKARFYSKGRNGKYLSCNDETVYSAGLNKSVDMLGQTDFDFAWWEEASFWKENDRKIIFRGESMLFLEPTTRFDGSSHTKTHCLSYKKPLRSSIHAKKIIGIAGFSFVINGGELPLNSMPKHPLAENSEPYEKLAFYSNLENKYSMTGRQKECLYYLTKGMASKQIARILNLSPRTIEHHIEAVKIKLGCFSRTQLIEKLHIG